MGRNVEKINNIDKLGLMKTKAKEVRPKTATKNKEGCSPGIYTYEENVLKNEKFNQRKPTLENLDKPNILVRWPASSKFNINQLRKPTIELKKRYRI